MATNVTSTQNLTNQTDVSATREILFNQTLLYIIIVYGAVIFFFNLAVTVFFFLKSKDFLKQGIHTVCLSVSDALTGIVICLLFGMTNYTVPSALCDTTFLLFLSSQSATGYQLLAISIERFYILSHVDKMTKPNMFRHPLYVIIIWASVIAVHLLPPLTASGRVPIDHWSRCRPGRVFGNTKNPAGILYSIVYILPLVAVNGFYFVTMVILKRRLQLTNEPKTDPSSVTAVVENSRQKFADKRKKQQQQIYITFFVILISLDISVLPKVLHFLFTKNDGADNLHIRMIMAVLCSINSLLNPIVYAFRWSEIRAMVFGKCFARCKNEIKQ